MKQNKITRRNFVKNTITASLLCNTYLNAATQTTSPNEQIQVAIIGLNNKGKQHIEIFRNIPGVKVACLCDIDKQVLNNEAEKFKLRNEKVKTYSDPRQVMDDKDIDSVVIVVPNHWHALMTIWACQAGKDVYIEKPLAANIIQGRQMIKAARKYNRIVQTGTQRRSDPGWKEAIDYIRKGSLGKIKVMHAIHYAQRQSIGKVDGPQPIPDSIDYNLWTGPAPLLPLMRKQFHYDWRWFWNYGAGEMIDNGVHYIDLCRWLIDYNDLPPQVISIGGRFQFNDSGQTPNTQIAFWDTKPAPIIIEIRNLPHKKNENIMDHYLQTRNGPVIQCEHGYYAGGWVRDNQHKKIKQIKHDGGKSHQANFIKAIRNRNRKLLNADVLEGHLSTAFCHLANISHLTGTVATTDQIKQKISDNQLFLETYERMKSHLLNNEINNKLTLGQKITYNPKTQTCKADSAIKTNMANELLKKTYRKGFEIPEII